MIAKWLIFCVLFILIFEITAVTHWVVTENGKIQPQLDSPYTIRRPYDLIALLNQETTVSNLHKLYQEVVDRKNNLEKKFVQVSELSEIGTKSLEQYECLKSPIVSDINYYPSFATNGTNWKDINVKLNGNENERFTTFKKPECANFKTNTNVSEINVKTEVNIEPEEGLTNLLPYSSLKLYGHEIATGLEKNVSSWFHYNLGAIFWRIKGQGTKSVECSKKAISLAPRVYKEIPLYTLAGTLHQAKDVSDAKKLLLEATDLSPKQAELYLALGNVYASENEFNTAISYFDKYLDINSDQNVIAIKHATLCFSKIESDLWKVEKSLLEVQQALQNVLVDIHEYHSLQQQWLRLQERLVWEQSPFEYQLLGATGTILERTNKECLQKITDNKNNVVLCDFIENEVTSIDVENLFNVVESRTMQINAQLAKRKQQQMLLIPSISGKNSKAPFSVRGGTKVEENLNTPPVLFPKFPTSISTTGDLYFDAAGWPTKEECNKWNMPIYEKQDLDLPVFLAPENKGFQIKRILTEFINLPEGTEHDLPWYPPNCKKDNPSDEKLIPNLAHLHDLKQSEYLRNHLLKYVNNGKSDESEIGQRIITAMEKKAAPTWVLATLASLYWRVRGNGKKAINCLDLALQHDGKEPSDVILVSTASIIHELGHIDEAIKFASLALKYNNVEPSTNFLLALLHYKNNNPLLAMYYMKHVLRVDKEFYDNKAEFLLKTWGCRVKLGAYKDSESEVPDDDMVSTEKSCTSGPGVVCSPNGEHCKTANIHCVVKKETPQYDDVPVALTEDPVPEAILNLYEKSGTLLLSPHRCKDIQKADWLHFTSMWQYLSSRNIDVAQFLKPLPNIVNDDVKPFCARDVPATETQVDTLISTVLKTRLPNFRENHLFEWLGVMAGDPESTLNELGAKISLALGENNTSWILANAAALYWRIVGNSEEAIFCLRHSLAYAPSSMKDIPLVSLANVLNIIGYYSDALDAAYLALNSHPNYVFNHFILGNIHSSMGDFEKAISFYRSSLSIDANFAPAKNRLLAISCILIFDEEGSLRTQNDLFD